MKQRDDGHITVLDFGSSKVCAITAEVHDRSLRYKGHGIAETRGVRRGVVSQLEPATRCVKEAIDAAEKSSGVQISSVVVGVGGAHVRGVNSRGGILLGNRLREISRDEIGAAVDRARSIDFPADREVLHLLPQEFLLDDTAGIRDPLGMVGSRLEVNLHIATCGAGALQSIVTAANQAGVIVSDSVYEGVAAAEATLSSDERELGICLVDIGAGSTELIVFFEGSVMHSAVLPIGGDHFTNDLAMGLHVSVAEAERLKTQYGHATVTAVPQISQIELPLPPDAPRDAEPRLISQRRISEIVEARANELFSMLRDNLRNGGVLEALGAGVVLTGGGARMPGLGETAESILRAGSRLAVPVPISQLPAELQGPEFTTAVGLLLYTNRRRQARTNEGSSLRSKIKSKILAGAY